VDAQAAAHRRRRFQHDAMDLSVEAVDLSDRARPLQHLQFHLANALAWLSAPTRGRHRQCVRVPRLRANWDYPGTEARFGPPADHRRHRACIGRSLRRELLRRERPAMFGWERRKPMLKRLTIAF